MIASSIMKRHGPSTGWHAPSVAKSVAGVALLLLPYSALAVGPNVIPPKVLWVHKAPEHFVAAPVVGPGELYVSSLGAFNSGNFYALSLDPAAQQRVRWSKTPPFLKRPTVSEPAVVDGKVIFGDGMHQTDGAVLHCLDTGTGRIVWQLPVPGQLVHLEGSPAVAAGRVFLGAGSAGVLSIDPDRLTLDGREQNLAEVKAILARRWQELLSKYEKEKKEDPDFAIPPNEDALPKPAPRIVWQQGQDRWHVDAHLAVAGDKVLVASSFLDEERLGDRSLLCLRTDDGSVLWKTPLKYNPWGGAAVAGSLAVVATSSIRFDPREVSGAKGELLAIQLMDGAVQWRREFTGGIVSPAVIAGTAVLFTATDGQLRALDLATGGDRWSYTAGEPMFAGPAVAGGTVYAADLKGMLHAVNLADGKTRWRFGLASDPVNAAGSVYRAPLIHEGRLYVTTCNLEDDAKRRPGAVVCFGEK